MNSTRHAITVVDSITHAALAALALPWVCLLAFVFMFASMLPVQAQPQTTAPLFHPASTSNITVMVRDAPHQTLKALGASEPLGNTEVQNDTDHRLRDQMMDLTFRDLSMTVVRLWANLGPATNYSGNLVDPLDDAHQQATIARFKQTYLTSGFVAAAKRRGVTTFLLGPSYPTYQATLPPDAYAKRVAAFIKMLRDDPDGVAINATGLINEPKGGIWKPDMIHLGVQTLQVELHRLGLDDVAVIAPENSNSDPTAARNVRALKEDALLWSRLSGIATHSYAMAASDSVGTLITDANETPTKDWWMTEAGSVNASGNDQARVKEAVTGPDAQLAAVFLAARFLNDMNHGVTHWIWFVAYGVKPSFNTDGTPNDTDGGQKLMSPSPDGKSVLMRPKYRYFKQLREAFPDGMVFRRSESSLDTDMLWSYHKRPHVSVAAGKNPDGSWGIGLVNLTPSAMSDKGSVVLNYAAAPYVVRLKIAELSKSGDLPFLVKRSRPTGEAAAAGTVIVRKGEVTLTVEPQELVTLRSARAGKTVTNR